MNPEESCHNPDPHAAHDWVDHKAPESDCWRRCPGDLRVTCPYDCGPSLGPIGRTAELLAALP